MKMKYGAEVDRTRSETSLVSSQVSSLSSSISSTVSTPRGSSFSQQTLSMCQPVFTAGNALPYFRGAIPFYLFLSVITAVANWGVFEVTYDYTHCIDESSTLKCSKVIEADPEKVCQCVIQITVPENVSSDIYLYYSLTNYYQNSLSYSMSKDYFQLASVKENLNKLDRDYSLCGVYTTDYDPVTNETKWVAPCGAVANSLFNDTFEIEFARGRDLEQRYPIQLNRTDITWKSQRSFRNPTNIANASQDTVKPKNWNKTVWELDPENPSNNGFENEPLIVWMRVAAFPTFRKIYGRLNLSNNLFYDELPNGTYLIKVNYTYPVTRFGGHKRLILSNTSWVGGKNMPLFYIFLSGTILCVILYSFFAFIDYKFGKASQEIYEFVKMTEAKSRYTLAAKSFTKLKCV